jgi:hypothetical protein
VGKLIGSLLQFLILAEIVGRGSVCAIMVLIGKRKHKLLMAVFNGDFYLRQVRGEICSAAAVIFRGFGRCSQYMYLRITWACGPDQ